MRIPPVLVSLIALLLLLSTGCRRDPCVLKQVPTWAKPLMQDYTKAREEAGDRSSICYNDVRLKPW